VAREYPMLLRCRPPCGPAMPATHASPLRTPRAPRQDSNYGPRPQLLKMRGPGRRVTVGSDSSSRKRRQGRTARRNEPDARLWIIDLPRRCQTGA
jgi:hypothetical protein